MLDDRDREILAALQEDARATYADIARRVNLSPSSVHDRVRKLEQGGVIRAYRAEVDPFGGNTGPSFLIGSWSAPSSSMMPLEASVAVVDAVGM